MSDLGLDRPYRAELLAISEATEGPTKRVELDRISQPGTAAMGFDHLQRGRINPEAFVDIAHQGFLRGGVGCGNAIRGAILIHSAGDNDAADAVAIPQCIIEASQHHHGSTFAGYEAVGARIEGVATTCWREHPPFRRRRKKCWSCLKVNATGDG